MDINVLLLILIFLSLPEAISAEKKKLRLVNGGSPCAGRVELYHSGQWGTVYSYNWDIQDAAVVCKQLECGSAVAAPINAHFGAGTGPVWMDEVQCQGGEAALWDCQSPGLRQHGYSHTWDAGVTCSAAEEKKLKLVNGGSPCAGRVELYHNGQWGTVYHGGWDIQDAAVVCKQLGCGSAVTAHHGAHFGAGTGPIWMYYVQCQGGEAALWDCRSPELRDYRSYGYQHSQDAGVTCSAAEDMKLRLVNGGSPCAGRVEVYHNDQWGTVSSYMWDIQDAAVVCKQLGCGSAVAAPTYAHFGAGTGPVWLYEVECEGEEAALWDCRSLGLRDYGYSHSEDAGVTCSEHKEVRLVDGDNKCQGRVEVKYKNMWHTVCDQYFDHMDASVICYELGCEHPKDILKGTHFGKGNDKILEHNIQCKGNESHLAFCKLSSIELHNCSHADDVGLICRGYRDYRLVNGSDHCSGRVELQYGYEWRTVCDVHWDLEDANVLCHQLNCGFAESTHGNAYFGSGDGRLLDEHFFCSGNESHLLECPVLNFGQQACSHKQDTGVICTGKRNYTPRLRNGGSRCEGYVEVYYSDTWQSVHNAFWDVNNANTVCMHLGCGMAMNIYNNTLPDYGNETVLHKTVRCLTNETLLWNCAWTTSQNQEARQSGHTRDANILCKEHMQLRLVNGGGDCAGRIEVYYNGSWGTVCDDFWDLQDANVVCKQLKCGHAISANTSGGFGQGSGPIWMDNLHCSETESLLWDCPSAGWGQHNCHHKEDVGVICSEFKQLRLANGENRCQGRLEVFHNGTWGTVCSNGLSRNSPTIRIVCQQLSCGQSGVLQTSSTFGNSLNHKSVDNVNCLEHHSSLWQCPSSGWLDKPCDSDEEVHIICSGTSERHIEVPQPLPCSNKSLGMDCTENDHLRLMGGKDRCSGTVEILNNGIWGTVCDDTWDIKDAEVVCRQLRCGGPLRVTGEPNSDNRSGPIWLDEVHCKGRELFLWDCLTTPWGQSDCEHKEDAGVICSGLPTTTAFASPIKDTVRPPPNPETSSFLLIITIILGALLFLLLIILCGQVQKHRRLIKGLALEEYPIDAFYDAVYEELDYNMLRSKQKQFQDQDIYSDDSINQLEYYTDGNSEAEEKADDDKEKESDYLRTVTKADYDDVETGVPVTEGYSYDDAESVPVIRNDTENVSSGTFPEVGFDIREHSNNTALIGL